MSNVPDYILEEVEAAIADPAAVPASMPDMARQLDRLRREKDGLDEAAKAKQKEIDFAEKILIEAMTEADFKNFTVDSIGQFIRKSSIYAQVEDKPALHGWLRATGNGTLIREDVHVSTLRSFVTNRIKEGESLPPGVKTFTKQGISIVHR
jgi:hypothetical protein